MCEREKESEIELYSEGVNDAVIEREIKGEGDRVRERDEREREVNSDRNNESE